MRAGGRGVCLGVGGGDEVKVELKKGKSHYHYLLRQLLCWFGHNRFILSSHIAPALFSVLVWKEM